MWLFSSFAVSSDDKDLKQFAWIYGSFPAAPAVYVFATQYEVMPSLIAATIVLSLIVTAPLMYIFTILITISPTSDNEANLIGVINGSPSEVGVASIVGCVLLLTYLGLSTRARSTSGATLVLALGTVQLCLPTCAIICHSLGNQASNWAYNAVLLLRWTSPWLVALLVLQHRLNLSRLRTLLLSALSAAGSCTGVALLHTLADDRNQTDSGLRCYWRYGRAQYIVEAAGSGLLVLVLGWSLTRPKSVPAEHDGAQEGLMDDTATREPCCIQDTNRIAGLTVGWIVLSALWFCRSAYSACHPSLELIDNPVMVQLTFLCASFVNAQGLFSAVCLCTCNETLVVLGAAATRIRRRLIGSVSDLRVWYGNRLSGASHQTSSVTDSEQRPKVARPASLPSIMEEEEEVQPVVLYGNWEDVAAVARGSIVRNISNMTATANAFGSPKKKKMIRNKHASTPDFRSTEIMKDHLLPRPPP
eukprot:TRINITY_DN24035_c0_g1_i4.p1 TRINITY_DN24035_c0_g1~~TRINITY_DN24035_c0_g1_i4.p1  ORF type:complete len:474 (+),score=98.69 TRINITY_DN24035_c0_g1_i4:193-1614(+)